jgi:hypothetical protein
VTIDNVGENSYHWKNRDTKWTLNADLDGLQAKAKNAEMIIADQQIVKPFAN